jgi:GT2 family glycosyltransferase
MPEAAGAATLTIIVAPGERFSLAPRSLRSLAAHTAPPFQLVYVDAGSPVAVRSEIEALAAEHGFTVIRNERPLMPNQARNLGLAAATGDVVVFTDNGLLFTPGWLPPLLDCARETGAGLVSPVILAGEARDGRIGFAGGDLVIDRAVEPAIATATGRFAGRRVADVAAQLGRSPSDYGAFACLLARRDLLQRIGPLDEAMTGGLADLDLALAVRAAGAAIQLEPRSTVIRHEAGEPTLADAAQAGLHWSDEISRRGLDRFAAKWRLDRTGPLFVAEAALLAARQKRAGLPLRPVRPPDAALSHTASELQDELGGLGYPAEDIAEIRVAVDIAAILFGGILRSSGRPFLAHAVGTASVLARAGAPAAAIAAGLLHSAYSHGRFPTAAGTTQPAQRVWLRRHIGPAAERLVEAFYTIGFDAADGAAGEAEIETMPLDLAFLTMIRVANEIDDHLDEPTPGRRTLPLSPLWPLFDRVLARLGAPAMVERLRQAVQPESPQAPVPSRPTSSHVHSPTTGEKTALTIRAPATRRALWAADPLAAVPRDAELIGITLVKNECDIIEAFVRYNLRILDGLVILDHESSDTTRAILQRLQDEGLPLAVLSGDEAPLRQALRTNLLLDRVRAARTPELVVPLDADEFIRVADRAAFVAALGACPAGMAPLVGWMTYLPMASDDAAELDPLRRIRHRRVAEPIPYWKAVMRRKDLDDERFRFSEGNHRIFDPAGRELPWGPVEGVALAHFPVRSAEQIRAKLYIGRMAERLSPDREPGQGVWWMTMHDRLATTDLRRPEGLQSFAALYSAPEAVAPLLDPLPDIPYARLAHADLIDVDATGRVAHYFDAVLGPAVDAVERAGRLEAELADSRAAVGRVEAAIARAEAGIARAEATIAALRQSTSWRITAPMRQAVTLLQAIRARRS